MPTKLGQNFLINEEIAENIVKSANLSSEDNVLEIGPGGGMLTRHLARKAGKVMAVEIDPALADKLDDENYKNTKIIEGDVLQKNLPKLIEENNFEDYKVVANLPYYITSKIIRLFLETKYPPREMILMVQKEVGERIVAKDGKESILSISVKLYSEPELIFEVSRDNFEPAPEVDSVVIRITRKKTIPDVDIKRFFSFVRAGFSAKRKMVVNNISSAFKVPKAAAADFVKKAGLEPKVRAEKLNVADWIKLYQIWPDPMAGQKTK